LLDGPFQRVHRGSKHKMSGKMSSLRRMESVNRDSNHMCDDSFGKADSLSLTLFIAGVQCSEHMTGRAS
jgi:hypothetical protein